MRHHLTWITLAAYWLVVAIQLLELVVIFSPMSYTQVVMHRPHKVIPRLQAAMMGREMEMKMKIADKGKRKSLTTTTTTTTTTTAWTRLKLKYDDLYGRLLSGPKLAITIGQLAEVTYFSTYELLLTYIAYLLLAFSQLMGG